MTPKHYVCPEGCIKTFQSFIAIQKYLNKGKHKVKLKKKNPYDKTKRKWTKTCHSVGGGYAQGRTSGKILTNNPSLASQVDFGWAPWKSQKAAVFSQKAKNYFLVMCWTGEETTKAITSNVASKISSLRYDTGEKCCSRLTGW